MKKKILGILSFVLLSCILVSGCATGKNAGGSRPDTPQGDGKEFNLFADASINVLLDGTSDSGSKEGEWPGVVRAAEDLVKDIEDVCSLTPMLISSKGEIRSKNVIIAGSLEKSEIIKSLYRSGKIDLSDVEGKWEAYKLQVISNPFNDGKVDSALVIAGSDKRGAIYGIYELSAMLGVSPYKYFADNPAAKKTSFTLASNYVYYSGEPTVKYRGIFLNDEEQLEFWARKLDGDLHMGPNVYLKIFEMLLRLKANYLWPAMHACSDAFNDYEENPFNADYYGIVIGTSHCDMLLRNNLNEWDNFKREYAAEKGIDVNSLSYDYTVSPEAIREYWRRCVRMNKDYEVCYTMGMRGAHDEGFTTVNINKAPWYGDRNMLLEQIIEDQKQILREELNNPTLEGVFMSFIPYKEVQNLYNEGLHVPEDITIIWPDDNHGYIRHVPDFEERQRSGGHGVYYHNSYWGPDDESYMWLNTMPLTLFYEELSKLVDYGATKVWVVNVGDIKPGEVSLAFIMDYAYNAETLYDDTNAYDFMVRFAGREFPTADAQMIKSVYQRLVSYTNVRKLEHMKVDLFTDIHYNDEFESRMADYKILLDDAEAIYQGLDDSKKDAFYEMILYQVRCAFYSNAEFYYATKSNFALKQGKSVTAYNCNELATWYNECKKYETNYFNKVLAGGKWDGIMTPEEYEPPVSPGYAEGSPAMSIFDGVSGGVVVEGEEKEQANSTLEFYNYAGGRKFIDVFSKGLQSFEYTVSRCPDWLILSAPNGKVYDEERIWASVDFTKLKQDTEETIVISYGDNQTKNVTIKAHVDNFKLGEKTYVEQDGYISAEAEHYSYSKESDYARFITISDLGRVSGDMIKCVSDTLTGTSPINFIQVAPYVEYNMYFTSSGEFMTEVYRLPTLSSRMKIRFAVQLDDNDAQIIEGESDYGVGNYAWEEGIYTEIIKHKLTIDVDTAGLHKLRIYMIDPDLVFDKIIVYTGGYNYSYLGPKESYNTTFNKSPDYSYERFYETKFLPQGEFTLTDEYGDGYFTEEDGQFRIHAAAASKENEYAYTTGSELNGGFMISVTTANIAMRTKNTTQNYAGRTAPTLNYKLNVLSGGTYRVYVEYNAPNPGADSFGAYLDGVWKFAKSGLFNYSKEETFVWAEVGSLSLSGGEHLFTIAAEEDGLIISKIVISKTSYTGNSFEFKQTARTPVTGANMNADLEKRREIAELLDSSANWLNISIGEALGDYTQTAYDGFIVAREKLLTLYNKDGQITPTEFIEVKDEYTQAYTALNSSKIMSADGVDYLIYEDYEHNVTGKTPYGLKVYDAFGGVNTRVYGEESNYLAIRTFFQQKKLIQRVEAGYDLAEEQTSGILVAETRVRANEAQWIDVIRLIGSDGNESVKVAIERTSMTKSSIVAYNGTTKRILREYAINEWVDIKVEVNLNNGTYNVYVDGEKLTSVSFKFRSSTSGISSYRFGCNVDNSNLNIDKLAVYKKA